MTTYDIPAGSDVDAIQDRQTGSRLKTAGQAARKRPGVTSAAALAVAAVAATGVIGGRKIAQARRPQSRWQRLLHRGSDAVQRGRNAVKRGK